MSGEYTFGASDDIVRRIRENLPHIEWEQPLAAERERLAAAEIERLRAEVERLRAAGDALAKRLWRGGGDLADMIAAVAAWLEARRG